MPRRRVYLLALSVAAAGCGGSSSTTNPPTADRAETVALAPPRQITSTTGGTVANPAPTPAPAKPAPQAAPVNIPKGARFTLFVGRLTGPDHLFQAKRVLDGLRAQHKGKLNDWYALHEADASVVYHGYYRAISPTDAVGRDEVADARRAQRDRDALEAVRDAAGNPAYPGALLVPLDAADPAAPPQWDLARSAAAWSVQIAAFSGSPDRKQAAVESVRAARAQGVEAYYYHGPAVSSVCVGAWPESAVEVKIVHKVTGGNKEAPLISTNLAIDDDDVLVDPARGDRQMDVGLVRERLTVREPGVDATMRRFPVHSVNGYEDVKIRRNRDGRQAQIATPSFIVRVPGKSDAPTPANDPFTAGGDTGAGGAPQLDLLGRNAGGATPDGLRGIGTR